MAAAPCDSCARNGEEEEGAAQLLSKKFISAKQIKKENNEGKFAVAHRLLRRKQGDILYIKSLYIKVGTPIWGGRQKRDGGEGEFGCLQAERTQHSA